MYNTALDPWTTFPGTASDFGLSMTMKLLSYRKPEDARRVVRQAFVRGKKMSELPSGERSFIENNFRRDNSTDIRYYRESVFIFSEDGHLITCYPCRFPKNTHYIGKEKIRNLKTFKAHLSDMDRIAYS